MRLAAVNACHEADCFQALQNPLHAGPRQRIDFKVGQVVYLEKGHGGCQEGWSRILARPMPSHLDLTT